MRMVTKPQPLPDELYMPDEPIAGANGLSPLYYASAGPGGSGLFRGTTRLWANRGQTGLTEDNLPVVFSSFLDVHADAGGFVAFHSTITNNGSFRRDSIWISPGGPPLLVAAQGYPAPGTGGKVFASHSAALSLRGLNAGQALYYGQLADTTEGNNSGLWLSGSGLVAREGDPAPGFPPGSVYTHIYTHAMLNAAGQVAFYGNGGVEPSRATETLWAGPPGNLKVVARTGDPAPGFEPGWTLRLNATPFGFNAAGTAVFRASVEHDLFSQRDALYLGDASGLTLLAVIGDQPPGVEAGARWIQLGRTQNEAPAINSSGEVFFYAGTHTVVNGVTDGRYGLWTGRPGQLRLVACTKDPAPDTAGVDYSDHGLSPYLISDSGQVVFKAMLNSSSQTSDALYATDKTGVVRLVARRGSPVADTPPVSSINLYSGGRMNGGNDGLPSPMDGAGNLAVLLTWWGDQGSWPGNQAIFSFSFAEAAPVIPANGQPTETSGVPGGRASFQVTALGSRPASYQWKRDGVNISGATGSTLTLGRLTAADRGNYTVTVTNAQGAITSAPARLRLPPVITRGPLAQNVSAGQSATLDAVTAGPGPLTWQWQYRAPGAAEFVNMPGATGPSLSLSSITAGQAGRYRVVAGNSDGSATSAEAVVTVAPDGAPILTRVLVPGDVVPGITLGRGFTTGWNPVINNAGAIAFLGHIDGSDGSRGTYLRTPDGQYHFTTYQAHGVNLSDSGVFAQINSRPATTIELGVPGAMLPLARRGDVAPGTGRYYYLNSAHVLADDGTTAFRYDVDPGTAVFIGKPGAVSLLAFSTMAAPGAGAGVTFESVLDPVINPGGTAAFFATLTGGGITEDNNTSLWKGAAAGVQQMVSEADPVPAAGAGVRVGEIRTPDTGESPFGWNQAGQVAFSTTLAGSGITAANDNAILAGLPGALQVVARDGVAGGYAFDLSGRAFPILNRTGQVAFVATITPAGTQDYLESLWLWTPGVNGGTRQLIAREGQQAPGLPAGVVFDSELLGKPFFTCALNGSGQLAVTARIAGPGISFDDRNDVAIYLTTPSGELKLVTRYGDPIDVGGGEIRELGDFSLGGLRSGGEDGRPRSLNEYGEFLLPVTMKPLNGFMMEYGIMRAQLPPSPGAYLPAYTAWAAAAFAGASIPAGDTLPNADADRDGVPNGLEYLFGANPRVPGASPVGLQSTPDGLFLTFPRSPGVPYGLETVETSTTFTGTWSPLGRTPLVRTGSASGQPQTVTVRLPAHEDQTFVRLRVTF